jgi:hypothetical protein
MCGTKIMVLVAVGMLAAILPQARADEWNQRTNVTFSGPVEIPGKVLPAGTYEFKLMDSQSDRNIVQVFSKDQKHLYGTFLTIPDYHLKPAGKTIITFEERSSGTPEAVKAWFYPGDNYGHEFVYPKTRALALAKANNTPVPSMPDNMTANTTEPATTMNEPSVTAMKQTPLKAQKPTQDEVEVTEVFAVPPPNNQTTAAAPTSAATTGRQQVKMPKTASPVPLIGMLGMLSLCAAASLRFALKQAR